MEIDSTDDYDGTSEIEIPEFGSNIAGGRIYNPGNQINGGYRSCSDRSNRSRRYIYPQQINNHGINQHRVVGSYCMNQHGMINHPEMNQLQMNSKLQLAC